MFVLQLPDIPVLGCMLQIHALCCIPCRLLAGGRRLHGTADLLSSREGYGQYQSVDLREHVYRPWDSAHAFLGIHYRDKFIHHRFDIVTLINCADYLTSNHRTDRTLHIQGRGGAASDSRAHT